MPELRRAVYRRQMRILRNGTRGRTPGILFPVRTDRDRNFLDCRTIADPARGKVGDNREPRLLHGGGSMKKIVDRGAFVEWVFWVGTTILAAAVLAALLIYLI